MQCVSFQTVRCKWVSDCCLTSISQVYHGENKSIFQWDDDDVRFVLDQHAELDFYSASSLIQQSTGRHVAPLGQFYQWSNKIIINSTRTHYSDSEPASLCSFSLMLCVYSGEATNTNFKIVGLTRPGLVPTIYRTRGEHANHYATDVVLLHA